MQVSARNVFTGTLTAVVNGAVNAEVELTTAGGDKLVAVVTEGSVKSLNLTVGTPVVAYVKAPLVMLLVGVDGMRFSARNQLSGTVSALTSTSALRVAETPVSFGIADVLTVPASICRRSA